MDSPQLATRATEYLIRDKEILARAVTESLFDEKPYLLVKHGERGRQKTLQDMRYNIEHLLPAVEMGDASMFARYVEWLNGILNARNVATDDVIRVLELLRNECDRRYGAEAGAIRPIIDAGLRVVQP